MNSFFKSLNGKGLRTFLQSQRYEFRILDFGSEQVFRSHNTYTCICIIKKTISDFIEYFKSSVSTLSEKKEFSRIDYIKLNAVKGWNLQNNEIITKIESTGKPLGELYKTSHGIATLKNHIYIFSPIDEDDKYYYLENDGLYQIEKEICKDIINSNKLNGNNSLEGIKEKIIFVYHIDPKPQLFDEKYLSRKYPKTYQYLLAKRNILSTRDKGNGNYENWFSFGRTQALKKVKNKLLFPKISNKSPTCIISTDDNLLYYNGQAIIDSSLKKLKIVKKIMESRVFWYYISSTSKPYSSSYYSLNGNYIRNFGIYELDRDEEMFLITEENKEALDAFLEKKYDIFF
jgi:hypothetical protein